MKDQEILACDPEIIRPRSKSLAVLRFRRVETTSAGSRRSDKHVQVVLTIRDAMKLLLLLCDLQEKEGLTVQGESKVTVVPPEKNRH